MKKVMNVLLIVLLMTACSSGKVSISQLEEKVSEKINTDVSITEMKPFKLTTVYIRYKQKGTVRYANWAYSKKKEKEVVVSEEKISQKEKRENGEFLFGPYSGFTNINITVKSKKSNFNLKELGVKIKEIKNQKVGYYKLKDISLTIIIPMDELVYTAKFILGNKLTSDKALHYAKQLIKES